MIENGRIVRQGTASAVFGPQATPAGEDRFARASVLNAMVAGEDAAYGLTELSHPAGRIWLAERGGAPGRTVRVVVHATDVTLALARPERMSVRTALAGSIAAITADDGPLASIAIALEGGDRLAALATRKAVAELGLKEGVPVFALIKTVALDERMIG
jgi:molybdate transport system ATP-binding protein